MAGDSVRRVLPNEHPASPVGTPEGGSSRSLVGRFASSRWLGVVAFAVAALLPFVSATSYSLSVMTSTAIFVMLAVGLNIVVGYCGLLDLGYAAFFAVGAYVSGVLATRLGLSLLETLPFVVLATVVAGLVIGGPTLRLRTDYLAIVTLGFGEIIRITANNLSITGGPSGIYGIPPVSLFGVQLTDPAAFYYFTLVVVALFVLGAARLGRSRLGRAWRFVREDEDAAEAMGVNTYTTKIAAYIAGAVWGGLAGVLFGAQLSAVSPPSFTFLQSALVLLAVVLGGMGSVPGVVLGAIFISIAPELLRDAANYRFFAFGVLLLIVMVFRPAGLWPARSVERPEALRHDRRPEAEPESQPTGESPRAAVADSGERGAPLLEVRGLVLRFGGVTAVDRLTFAVHESEIVSVIGPNGAGKTSAFNCITGFYRPTEGEVLLAGRPVARLRPSAIAARGVSRTFQNLRLFGELTVLDNIRAGMHTQVRQNALDALLHLPRYRRTERRCTDEAHRWLDFVGFPGDRGREARHLSYGEQRLVEIARALATRPRLLLLDEPGAGLNSAEKGRLLELIQRIQRLGIAVVLIEHDMGLVMNVSDRVVVLNYGKEIADGPPEEVKRNPAVIEAYLGADAEEAEVQSVREEVVGRARGAASAGA